MQLVPPVTLNGLPLRYSLQFHPATFFLLTHVVILSMAFLGTHVLNYSHILPFLADLDVIKMFTSTISTMLSFWNWFKFFPPKSKLDPSKVKKRRTKGKARKLLKLLMVASSTLPTMTKGPENPFQSDTGSPLPAKVITSTAALSGYNLQELRSRLSTTSLFSIFNGLITTPFIPVLLDCGASACTSPTLDAFEPETLTKLAKPVRMEGIAGQVDITMQGIIKYQTIDDLGNPLYLRVPAYYTPHIKQSLFSPQVLFMTSQPKGYIHLTASSAILKLPNQVSLTLQLDPCSRLYFMHTFINVQQAADELLGTLQLTQANNSNLSRGQKNLLRFHHALCHVGFSTIRKIGKLGWLGSKGLQLGDTSTPPSSLCILSVWQGPQEEYWCFHYHPHLQSRGSYFQRQAL